MTYDNRLRTLRHELSLLKLDKTKLKPYQKTMLEFIEGKKNAAQFSIDGTICILVRGDLIRGFEHILMRHYCHECEGRITAREILNIGFVLMGRKLSDYELNEVGKIGYEITKNELRLRVILNKDGILLKVLTHFSSRKVETGDLS